MKRENNTITKFKTFFDPDKEIAYINEMNAQGWKLVFIKWGMYYTFEKCEPGEYVTLLHADQIENISKVTSFAIQCGYEIIPHTIDGFGNTLYLTGRKEDVSEDFVSDTYDKITFYQNFKKNFKNFFIAFIVLDVILFLLNGLFVFDCILYLNYEGAIPTNLLIFYSIFFLFSIVYFAFTAKLIQIIRKYNKKIKKLQEEALIFE